jgi:allantoin racemase
MRVHVVVPVLYSESIVEKVKTEYIKAAAPATQLSFSTPRNGTLTIESEFDLVLAAPETMREAIRAGTDGADAVVIACTEDPGGQGAKEALDIPVVGEGEAGLHLASLLSYRFSIVTVRQRTVPGVVYTARKVGLESKVASVRPVDFGVMDLTEDCVQDVIEASRAAVLEDGAEAIVLWCTGTALDMPAAVTAALERQVDAYVPVIDPIRAAIGMAESLVNAGYRQSGRTYPKPPSDRSEYRWFEGGADGSTVDVGGRKEAAALKESAATT